MLGVLLVFVIGIVNVALGFAVAIYFGHGPRWRDIDEFFTFLLRDTRFGARATATDELLDSPAGDEDLSKFDYS